MKKFSTNYKNIDKPVKVKTTEEKIQELIENNLVVEINDEPQVNENYTIDGKDELVKILTDIHNDEVNKEMNKLTEQVKAKYHNFIDRKEIELIIEKLQNQ
jgi:hypothetical protein